LLSPVLYLVASVLAVIICVLAMIFLSAMAWIPLTVLFVVPFPFVGAVLAPCVWGLLRLERLPEPGLRDHVRHCALLYTGIAIVCAFLLAYPGLRAGNLQYDAGITVCAAALCAILLNATVVFSMRRINRTRHRSAA
jgi:hypothetical protein